MENQSYVTLDDDGTYVSDVLDASYEILENSADLEEQIAVRDVIPLETREAREAQEQALRARYQKPEPRPRQRRLDTFKGEQWNDWCDARIAAALQQRDRAIDKAVGRAIGQATAKLQDEIATLRRELDAARRQIKELKQRRNVAITSWHVDRKAFTVTPFVNEKPGTTINLRPLFEEYRVQTS